jgi:hypothetical protein
MLAALLFVAAALALIVALLLAMVVAGIRQEPTDVRMTSRAPRPTAALARLLLGAHVRRPDSADDVVDEHRCSCLASQGSEGQRR